jgi:two-component system cell cycle response regulator
MTHHLGDTSLWELPPDRPGEPPRHAWLTVLVGEEAGRVYSLAVGRTLLGRALDASLVFSDEQISRHHLEIEVRKEGSATVRDLGSTNGTLIGSRSIGRTPIELRDGAKLQVGGALVLRFSYRDHVEENFERHLYDTLTSDPLTGVHNKRFFHVRLEREFGRAREQGEPLSLVMLDLDDFKAINDCLGHAAGDAALREVAAAVSSQLREGELVARYGGEEFVVILRSTRLRAAMGCAERLRRAIAETRIEWEGRQLRFTASLGVASTESGLHQSAERLLIDADDQLYRAKNLGKNRVCGANPPAA